MADELDPLSCPLGGSGEGWRGDVDRAVDGLDFRRRQAELWKQRFRDAAAAAEESSVQPAFDKGFRTVADLARFLGRCEGALEALLASPSAASSEPSTAALLSRVRHSLHSLRHFSMVGREEGDGEESLVAGPLPAFDPSDMEAFLGHDDPTLPSDAHSSAQEASSTRSPVPTEEELAAQVAELRGQAESLLEQVCALLHRRGICDSFVYAK